MKVHGEIEESVVYATAEVKIKGKAVADSPEVNATASIQSKSDTKTS